MIDIIYEDNEILAVNKPPGLIVDPSSTAKEKTLADILSSDFQIKLLRGGIVHRLDKETSGILLVAKTQKALEDLQAQFKERKIKKEYLALVHGEINRAGVVDAAIGRNPKNREKFTVVPPGRGESPVDSRVSPPGSPLETRPSDPSRWSNGLVEGERWAVTEYTPEKKFQIPNDKFQTIFNDLNKIQTRKLERMNYNQFTLLNCQPKTGRTHQIRVHLKYINHPIVSDEKYVGRKMYRLDKRWCPRLFLHAKQIGFYHPKSGEWMELESELPEDLKTAFNRLSS